MRRLMALLFAFGTLAALLPAGGSAGGPPPPPNCESGQISAASNTSANGADDPAKHFGRFLDCLYGH
jgi:hypothetical protein